jgi:hypothetical protein
MTTFKFLIFLICLSAMSCKKESIQSSTADNEILYDTADFGTRINIGNGRYTNVYWGRNSDEIFVSVGTQYDPSESIQVDLLTRKSSRMDLAEAFVKGRNFDNSSMVMLGRMNNVYGYYLYHFKNGTYSLLLKAQRLSVNSVYVSGSAVFYGGGDTLCPLNSGSSCADWSPGVYFHYINADSKKIVPLPLKRFHSFSKTGKRTVLDNYYDSIYIFDNDRAMVVDSLKNDVGYVEYFDDETGVVKALVEDNAGEVTIINAKTKDVIQKFRPSVLVQRFIWSRDGTKLYYWEFGINSAVGFYDLISKKETIIGQISRIPFYMYPSVDDKKILFFSGSREKWYVKQLQ